MVQQDILIQRQSMSLDEKIMFSKSRIREWYQAFNGNVYVSFSGGKDSTVLLHLVRSIYPNVKAVFLDTGVEFPEIKEFVNTIDNVEIIKPKKTFYQIIKEYGYPFPSKEVSQYIYEINNTKSEKLRNRRLNGDSKGRFKLPEKWRKLVGHEIKVSHVCCNWLKKYPVKHFEKESGLKPFVGTMAVDSNLRKQSYMKTGCNSFSSKRPMSIPISFWLEKDIWEYIKRFNLPYSKIYDMGYERSGCIFCLFASHLETPNRLQLLKISHPKLYEYCLNTLKLGNILDLYNIPY